VEGLSDIVLKKKRIFLPTDYKISSWKELEPFCEELNERKINSAKDLEDWLRDLSEFEAVLAEEFGWRYIKMSRNTSDEELYFFRF